MENSSVIGYHGKWGKIFIMLLKYLYSLSYITEFP